MDLFAAEIGMDPAEVRRKQPARPTVHRAAHQRGRRDLRHRRLRDGAGQGARRGRLRRPAGRAGRAGASAATPCSSASALSVLRRDHRRRRRAGAKENAARRGAPRRHGHRAHRHLAARAGPRDGLGDARQRAARHPDREDHRQCTATPTSIPARRRAPMGSRSLQQGGAAVHQAAGELVELAKQRAADVLEADADDLVVDLGAAALAVRGHPDAGGHAWPSSPSASGCCVGTRVRRAGRRRSRSARTSPSSRSTSSPARRCSTGSSPSTTPGTVLNPLLAEGQRHGGIAQGVGAGAAGGGRLRRRRQPADRHASPTTPFPSATELPSFELRRHGDADARSTRWASRGSARRARSAPPRRCRTRSSTRVAHLGVRHIDMPATPHAGVAGDPAAGTSRRALMKVDDHRQRRVDRTRRRRAAAAARALPARRRRAHGHQHRLRHHVVRRVHGARSTASR